MGWDAVTRSPASGRWRTIPQAGHSPLFRIPISSSLSPATWHVLVRKGCLRSRVDGVCFPWLLSVCRPPHHTPRQVLLGLPSVVKGMRLPRLLSVAWGKALGHLLLLNPGVIRCPATMLFLKSVFFLFSEFYSYLFKFQSMKKFSRDQYEKMSVCCCLAQDSFLNPLLFIFFFRLPNLS